MDPPISRRKSCLKCIRGKRKCDRTLPRCKRCERGQFECHYTPPTEHNPSDRIRFASPVTSSNPQPIKSCIPRSVTIAERPNWQISALSLPHSSKNATWDFSQLYSDLLSRPNPCLTSYTLDPAEQLLKTQLTAHETNYCVATFRSFPYLWLSLGSVPFIHPRLISPQPPLPLRVAYSACAIYTTKTDPNSSLALSIIDSYATTLIDSGADDKYLSWSTPDILVHIQALIIFQIIRLFDDDIKQRALAESMEDTLLLWTMELHSQALTQGHLFLTTSSAGSWDVWIFAESIRRTIIMAWLLHGIYAVIKSGFCTIAPLVTAMSFTAHKSLWEATSAKDWARIAREEEGLWVEKMEFNRLLRRSTSDKLDVFGRMLAVTYCSEAAIHAWERSSLSNEGALSYSV